MNKKIVLLSKKRTIKNSYSRNLSACQNYFFLSSIKDHIKHANQPIRVHPKRIFIHIIYDLYVCFFIIEIAVGIKYIIASISIVDINITTCFPVDFIGPIV